MENKLSSEEKRKKFLLELKDLLTGAAFPIMLMCFLSASIISFTTASEELPMQILILVIGEILLCGAYVIFGKQNGVTAYRKTIQNGKKRNIDPSDVKARLYVGEYALYKGFLIAFISCIPFIIFQIIGAAAPNKVCDFMLQYAFGWAVFPFKFASLSPWLNLLFVIPLTCVHAVAYVWGGKTEEKKQNRVAEVNEIQGKNRKK